MTMPFPSGLVDCHTHAWTAGLPMTAARHYTPQGDRPAVGLLADMGEYGIAAAVVVQPSFLADNNRYLVETLGAAAGRLRGVAVFPLAPSTAHVSRLHRAGVRAMRLNLFGPSILPDPQKAVWSDALEAMRKLSWHIVVAGSGGPLADALARLAGLGLRLVIDHYAMPSTADASLCPGLRALAAANEQTECWVKLSAPYRLQAVTPEQAIIALNRIGFADRYVWGSDAPFTRFEHEQSYPSTLAALARLAGQGLADPDALRRNALHLYFDAPTL